MHFRSISILALAFGIVSSSSVKAQEWSPEQWEAAEWDDKFWDYDYDYEWDCECECEEECRSQRVFVDPEFYHVKRSRSGGSYQNGYLYGAKIGYNRIKRNSFYWEINGNFAEGRLKGKNARGASLVSDMTDTDIEGRIGFSIQQKCGYRISFTPYVGYGYFNQANKFVSPSPIKIKFTEIFHYASAGFLSRFLWNENLALGLNFAVKYPWDSKSKVSDDPDPTIDKLYLIISNRPQYEVELPISYFRCGENGRWELDAIPFYQLRQFGGHENYPYDFLKTKLSIFGLRLGLALQF